MSRTTVGPLRRRSSTNAIVAAVASIAAALAMTLSVAAAPPAAAAAKGCTVTVENPHYSKGAGGMIAKARVTCMEKRTVTFTGSLGAGPLIGPAIPIASNSGEQRVVDPATKSYETFYIPKTGSSGGPCVAGKYYSSDAKITVSGEIDTAASVKVAVC